MSIAQADMRPVIRKLVARAELSDVEVTRALDSILNGEASDASIAAFLIALAMKGETPREVYAILQSITRHATRITPNVNGRLIDTCGTGGDSIRTFNISTAAAVVAAAAGAKVAKHGNRSVSGVCGSADFLESIGINLNSTPSTVQRCIEQIGIGFLFAPVFHPAMKHVASARRTIGVRTVFNVVGPLSNPCTNISGQVIGVFEPYLMETLAETCPRHLEEAMIVHAVDGFDELSNTCENDILWVTANGQTKRLRLNPRVVGIGVAKPEQLIVNTKEDAIKSTLAAIYGKGPQEKEDIVILNASAALVVGKIAENFKEGVELAKNVIESGKAQGKLADLVSNCGNEDILEEVAKKYDLQ
jgi:anthranilate phosphoribosyltransferase